MQKVFLGFLAFFGGLVTLGAELSASRLIAPFFGTSIVVWSSLIGLILIALALGNWAGGRIADRAPRLEVLLHLVLAGAVLIGLAPLYTRPVLALSLEGFAGLSTGLLAGSFAGALALMGPPMFLLGCITPFAVRLSTPDVAHAGRIAGRLVALSTAGSFVGCFLPVLVLIPSVGTRWTFILLAALLLVMCSWGYVVAGRKGLAALPLAVLAGLVGLGLVSSDRPVKPGEGVLWEAESPYQYVRVVENDIGWRLLRLNEGVVSHSKYHPTHLWAYGIWDYFPLAPFFNPAPATPLESARRWAMIGAAGGTGARIIRRLYPEAEITGVEIDPVVVEAGRRFFHPPEKGYEVAVRDGRSWLKSDDDTFDVIIVDAYRQPYIPFELTTVECFSEIRHRLSDNGVLAMNVARPGGDNRLLDALATSVRRVFPCVYFIHLPERNQTTLLVATVRESSLSDFTENTQKVPAGFAYAVHTARQWVTDAYTPSVVLTDDRAPVERLMDLMVWRYLRDKG